MGFIDHLAAGEMIRRRGWEKKGYSVRRGGRENGPRLQRKKLLE